MNEENCALKLIDEIILENIFLAEHMFRCLCYISYATLHVAVIRIDPNLKINIITDGFSVYCIKTDYDTWCKVTE